MVDPEPLMRRALVRALSADGFDVVAAAATIANLPRTTRRAPDVIVVGWDSSGRRDIEGLRRLAADRRIKTVVIAPSRALDDVNEAFAAGASAFILKSLDPADLAPLIREVVDENIVLAPPLRDRPAIPGGACLTPREEEVLARIAGGASNRTIAAELWLSEPTVKFHLHNIYRKLGARGRTDASRLAREQGLIPRSPVR